MVESLYSSLLYPKENQKETPEDTEGSENNDKENSEGNVDPEKSVEDADATSDFDPTALPVVRTQLEKRKKKIERGFDYAVSAQVLLEGRNETSLKTLAHLAAGVVNHAQISTVQYYEILYHIVPELQNDPVPNAPDTCVSPWASLCPPKLTERDESPILTSAVIIRLMEYCKATEPEPAVCQAQAAPNVPTDIPDGYFGYYEPHPRDEFDPLTELCSPVAFKDPSNQRKDLKEMEDQLDKFEEKRKGIEKEISEMETKIGGLDEPVVTLGVDGELHSLQNKCFSTEAGKYIYEICLYGQAKQKEKSGGSTSLGNWVEATLDKETGKRVWKWDKGIKCWNGPQRSMTAYVTCGAETKVISADEPDTCRYEVQVESPVGCDDVYQRENGLDKA